MGVLKEKSTEIKELSLKLQYYGGAKEMRSSFFWRLDQIAHYVLHSQ